jgi:hypothetical protein
MLSVFSVELNFNLFLVDDSIRLSERELLDCNVLFIYNTANFAF